MTSDFFSLHTGDCLEVMRGMDADSVDAIVTDPPYGLSFMGKKWDYDVPSVEIWAECLRVLRPGGHLLAFAGTRTQHRMSVRIEDAGFEIRDMIAWVYGSGFPKSMDATEAMKRWMAGDRAGDRAGVYKVTGFLKAARDRAGWNNRRIDALFGTNGMAGHWTSLASQPAVPSVRQWEVLKSELGFGDEVDDLVAALASTERPEDWGQGASDQSIFLDTLHSGGEFGPSHGWGTALKPALEPITVARKPLVGTVAQNVMQHGTGALNIDGCRVSLNGDYKCKANGRPSQTGLGDNYDPTLANVADTLGRWPANLIHDGSDEVVGLFPQTVASPRGVITQGGKAGGGFNVGSSDGTRSGKFQGHGDSGSAARFFYCAKASKRDREDGLDGVAHGKAGVGDERPSGGSNERMNKGAVAPRGNTHPTVKPTDLMRYLCRLVTPPNGVVLDPFAGSGSTGRGAVLEGFRFVGIEREAEYAEIARRRIAKVAGDRTLFGALPR